MVLQLFFTLAFSAVPLTLYVPPVRSLNLFLEAVEGFLRESRIYSNRVYPRVRVVWSRLVDCMLCSNMRKVVFASGIGALIVELCFSFVPFFFLWIISGSMEVWRIDPWFKAIQMN
ncbi:hypothetical protein ACB094_11G178800 [Castanea mollissima]